MRGSNILFPKAGTALSALALGGAVLLGGCSGRDTSGSEQLAAMNAAALRAEKAAERAEAAAAKIDKAGQPTVVEAEPDANDEADDTTVADQEEPVSTEPDVKT